MPEIDTSRLAELLAGTKPYLLVDVGLADRFLDAHVPMSVFMEADRAASCVDQWIETAHSVMVVICDDNGEGTARTVAEQVRMRGFSNVGSLKGGFAAYASAGQPTVSGWMPVAHGFGKTMMDQSGVPSVSPAEVETMAPGDTLIVDVRTPDEYARATIPGARNIPGGELLAAADALRRAPVGRIVVHCAGRTRGAAAGSLLCDLGLTNVAMLDGGTAAWTKSGKNLVEGANSRHCGPALDRPGSEIALQKHLRKLRRCYQTKLISPSALATHLAARKTRPVCVVDTRTLSEYEAGHVPGSLWKPAGEIAPSLDDLVAVRNALVVLISDSGTRATVADTYCRRVGGFKSRVLDGGLHAWRAAGLPLENGAPTTPPTTAREREGARIRAAMASAA